MSAPSSSSSPPPASGEAPPRRALWRNPFLWAAVFGLITIPLLRPLLRHVPEPPPVVGTLPAFTLTDQDGDPFGTQHLQGQVWIANFFFTTCRSICPGLTRSMKSLQDRFAQAGVDVHLVSITVDPENDTPERLKAYAEKYGADPARWTFLTGQERAVRAVVVDGFKTHMGEKELQSNNLIDIAHAPYFVLVDGERGIRGYYKPDDSGLDEIFHRAQHVIREQRER